MYRSVFSRMSCSYFDVIMIPIRHRYGGSHTGNCIPMQISAVWYRRRRIYGTPLLRTQNYQRLSFFKSGLGQNIPMHAWPTARNSAFPSRISSKLFFFSQPKSLLTYAVEWIRFDLCLDILCVVHIQPSWLFSSVPRPIDLWQVFNRPELGQCGRLDAKIPAPAVFLSTFRWMWKFSRFAECGSFFVRFPNWHFIK